MPNMDGTEALKEIKAYDSNAKVIMITAAGQQHKVIEALKLGAKRFITKPFGMIPLVISSHYFYLFFLKCTSGTARLSYVTCGLSVLSSWTISDDISGSSSSLPESFLCISGIARLSYDRL